MIVQKVCMWCIIISIICEYFFLIVNIYYIIKTLIESSKKNKDQQKKDELEEFLIYKWVRNNDTLKRKQIKDQADKSITKRADRNNAIAMLNGKSNAGPAESQEESIVNSTP